jgi:CRISPR/Cas system CSM-associated protein Csm4 (group 5 of RAMP superfamily)
VNWDRGSYSVVTRGGWVDSPVRSGGPKKLVRQIAEGSVLSAPEALLGAAPDVAPDGFPHPVYRAGFAYAIPLPAVTA